MDITTASAILALIIYLSYLILKVVSDYKKCIQYIRQQPLSIENIYHTKINKAKKFLRKISNNDRIMFIVVDDYNCSALALNLFGIKAILIDISLFENLSDSAINTIIAHEYFHIKSRHQEKQTIFEILIKTFPLALFIAYNWNNFNDINSALSFIIVGKLSVIFSITFLSSYISQKQELDADKFAVMNTPNGKQGFIEISSYFENLRIESKQSNAHRLQIFIESLNFSFMKKTAYYFAKWKEFNLISSHPSWQSRLKSIEKIKD